MPSDSAGVLGDGRRPGGRRDEDANEALDALAIGVVEARRNGRVQVEDAAQRATGRHRHHQLGSRVGVAGDVPRERVHVGNDDGLAS